MNQLNKHLQERFDECYHRYGIRGTAYKWGVAFNGPVKLVGHTKKVGFLQLKSEDALAPIDLVYYRKEALKQIASAYPELMESVVTLMLDRLVSSNHAVYFQHLCQVGTVHAALVACKVGVNQPEGDLFWYDILNGLRTTMLAAGEYSRPYTQEELVTWFVNDATLCSKKGSYRKATDLYLSGIKVKGKFLTFRELADEYTFSNGYPILMAVAPPAEVTQTVIDDDRRIAETEEVAGTPRKTRAGNYDNYTPIGKAAHNLITALLKCLGVTKKIALNAAGAPFKEGRFYAAYAADNKTHEQDMMSIDEYITTVEEVHKGVLDQVTGSDRQHLENLRSLYKSKFAQYINDINDKDHTLTLD